MLPLTADVTDRDAVFAAVAAAVDRRRAARHRRQQRGNAVDGHGRGVHRGRGRAQMETNFFGALWVSQAVMPHLRAQGSGHIVQVSSIGGLGGFPSTGMYAASKFALEGVSEGLAMEARRLRRQGQHPPARRLLDGLVHRDAHHHPARRVRPAARRTRKAVRRRL
ncbi:SDR family NAD(P)-dependent oxidoreductase [Yinghuangia aomiensis]